MEENNFELIEAAASNKATEVGQMLKQLQQEAFGAQFWQMTGRVAELGQENGVPKLDWVNGLEKALAHPHWFDDLLTEASEILADSAIKHIVWSGMGGSVMTVHCLKDLGLLTNNRFTLHILDSTDPAQLNQLLHNIAQATGLTLEPSNLSTILSSMLMIGVSMGMTSEEPITHLRWFATLLTAHKISPENHLRVLTLPASYLHKFADEYGVKRLNLQLDGHSDTPGRMSAPTTKVFLLPLALQLLARTNGDTAKAREDMQMVLTACQNLYQFNSWDTSEPQQDYLAKLTDDPFVQLGAIIATNAKQGRNKVILRFQNAEWQPLFGWIEQIVEESLGKNGKGFLIFPDQPFEVLPKDCLVLDINSNKAQVSNDNIFQLVIPSAASSTLKDDIFLTQMILTAAFFANFKKTVVTFAYLNHIVFAGQPAVEGYKRYAREIRDNVGEIKLPPASQYQAQFGSLVLDYTAVTNSELVQETELQTGLAGLASTAVKRQKAAQVFAVLLNLAHQKGSLGYADLTFNGVPTSAVANILKQVRQGLFNQQLNILAKVRQGPQDYHSTEQSETDGPPELLSLRLVAATHEPITIGEYSDRFLLAQALGTVTAMQDAHRWVLLLVLPDLNKNSLTDLQDFFQATQAFCAQLSSEHS